MIRMIGGIVVAAASVHAAPDSRLATQDSGLATQENAERLNLALQWFSDADPEIRELGRRELVALGREAVPKLEELLKAKDAYEVYRLLREIETAGPENSELPRFPEGAPTEDAPAPLASAVEKYVFSKMKEVYRLAKAGRYEQAYKLSEALLVLEPRSKYAADIHKYRKYCDNMITQTLLVQTRVTGPAAGAAGAKVELTLRMENVFKKGIEVAFEKGTPEAPAKAFVIVEIACERATPSGLMSRLTRHQEVEIEHDIPIAMGAQWERTFTLDTSLDYADDDDNLRVYTVGAWTPVVKIDNGAWVTRKRIYFEPATFKVVPEKYFYLSEEPLAKLGKAMDSGSVHEVFIAAMLLSEEQKPMGVEMLVAAFEKMDERWRKAPTPEERTRAGDAMAITANVLSVVTGQKLGLEAKRWRAYADELKAEAKPTSRAR
ncbi:MAG: hypothetical protein HY716_00575 [Planctomycetes bacterium]|nr:hypothetical protein [Planctomycetota bacterium]